MTKRTARVSVSRWRRRRGVERAFYGVGLLVALGCGASKPPPPVIETQEAELRKPGRDDDRPIETPTIQSVAGNPEHKPGAKPVEPKSADSSPKPIGDTAGGEPTVKLLDAGSKPHRELRHAFGKGTRQKLSLKAKTRVGGASLPIPALRLSGPMEARIVEVNASKEARFELTAGPFKTEMAGGGGDQLGGVMGGLLGSGPAQKLAGWGWVTSRGVFKEFHVTSGASGGDAPVETGDPFPEEAVGVGARWEVRTVVRDSEGAVEQLSTYTLVKMDKKSVRTKMTRVQQPLGPGGAGASESSGELVYRLGEVYPTGTLSMTRAMNLNLPGLEGTSLTLSSDVEISKK